MKTSQFAVLSFCFLSIGARADDAPPTATETPTAISFYRHNVEGDVFWADSEAPAYNGATRDETLISLAKAANVNLLADATDFPEKTTVSEFPTMPDAQGWRSHLHSRMMDLSREQNLTLRRASDRVFLFWSKPDLVALAKRIELAPNREFMSREPSAALREQLIPYLRKEKGWDGQDSQFAAEIKLADLPPELGADLIAQSQRALLTQSPVRPSQNWLDESVWPQVRVWFNSPKRKRLSSGVLYLGYQLTEGDLSNSMMVGVASTSARLAAIQTAKTGRNP